ncbi:hypothetical protein ACTFIZ_008191 [Dictyostelium cf. discoideum]
MGNYFSKQQEMEMSIVAVNKKRVFDVYLNVYANSSDQTIGGIIYKKGEIKEIIGTNSGHYSIIIDRNGEFKNDLHPVGLEMHLVMVDPNHSIETTFYCKARTHNSPQLIKTIKVGKCLSLKTKEYIEACYYSKEYIVELDLLWPDFSCITG